MLKQRVADKDALVCLMSDVIDQGVIDAGTRLKIVSNVAVGYNNIDHAYARSRGIVVTNTPDVLTESVADFTWAMILAITRRLAEGDRLIRRGGWKAWAFDFMLGTELRGKQLGLVGFGRIARAVAARAPVFGMRVAYTDVSAGGRPVRKHVARPPAEYVGRRLAPREPDARDPSSHRQEGVCAHEAVGVSREHRARSGGR